jgi:lipopolysaccharide export system ATP-binding protein
MSPRNGRRDNRSKESGSGGGTLVPPEFEQPSAQGTLPSNSRAESSRAEPGSLPVQQTLPPQSERASQPPSQETEDDGGLPPLSLPQRRLSDEGDSAATAFKLSTVGLRKVYRGRAVVQGVSIEVGAGEIVGLIGPNGAGKTTTFYMVVGLTQPDAGQVFLGDDDITDLPMYLRAQRGISYLPQEPSIFRRMSVEDNLRAIFETLDLAHAEQERRIDQLIQDFGLSKVRRSKGYALSGGERRRVEIARALVISPWYILLDEPFAGIDPIAVLEIQGIVRHLKAMGIGVLITDHNVRETLKITDRAYIINNGEILRAGTPPELSSDPQVRKIYLGQDFSL